jgi:hypothetical protein
LRIGAAIPVALALLLSPSIAAAGPPTIDSESVSGITSTNAILEAQVSPHGGSADVQFQLVTDPEEFASEILCLYPPPESTPICLGDEYGEGVLPILNLWKEPHQVSLDLSDPEVGSVTLQPSTTYHYRVLAATAIFGEDTIEWEPPPVIGEDRTFTTLGEGSVGPPLTLKIEEGEGTVVSNPAGLLCTGAAGHECTTEEIEAGPVTLTASPASGYLLKSWKGCGTVEGRKCKVTLSAAKTVGAKFTPSKDLTVNVTGSGRVAASPGGATCSPSCASITAAYRKGTAVTLAATPSKHFHFLGWSGDCPGSCTMSEVREATATFAEDPKATLALALEGGGQAQIKAKPAGIECGYTCSGAEALFYEGEAITLSWKLNKGTTSIDWTSGSGTCTGKHTEAEGSCTVTLSGAASLAAKLE